MFALHDCSVPCVSLLYLHDVCLEREEQNEDKKRNPGKEERIWKDVIRRERGGNKVGSRKKKEMLGLTKIREAVLISIHFDKSVDARCLII